MPTTVLVKTAAEFAQKLGPHLEHQWYRCDKPHDRLMGKGCRTCGEETYISIADFRANGDLEAYERALKPFEKKDEAKKAG
ncbi:MAG TPA: hypothetical protein VND93_08530 [Myxococcales bacterium]|nr:hypothetical protein [Myxococcales bacterium]